MYMYIHDYVCMKHIHLHICAYIYRNSGTSHDHECFFSPLQYAWYRVQPPALKYFNSRENNNLCIKYSPSR